MCVIKLDLISNYVNKINWLDDCVSAIISTFLAVGISWIFFYIGNRNAFMQDIMEPIKNTINDCSDVKKIVAVINEKTKLFSYRYAKKNEKKIIEDFKQAAIAKYKNEYDDCFSEAIWNYFYNIVNEQRIYEYVDEYGHDIKGLCFQNETDVDLKQYAGAYDEEGEYVYNDEVKRELIWFYKDIIKGSLNVDELLKDFNAEKVVNESKEYIGYKEADSQFEEHKKIIMKL